MNRVTSALIAVATAVVVALQGYVSDDTFTRWEQVMTLIAAVGAYRVWQTANTLDGTVWGRFAKPLALGVTAGLELLASLIATGGDLTASHVTNILLVTAGAILVAVTNRTAPVWDRADAMSPRHPL